jgi:peptidyl-prolyl cis-trans isomerase SurA
MISFKKINKIIIYSILYIFLHTSIVQAVENKIILKVENLIVTSFELKNKIKTDLILRKMEINQKNINEIKQRSLRSLLNLKIKESELKKFNIKTLEGDVIKQIISITSVDLPEVKRIFISNNIDYELFFNEVKTELTWQKYVFALYGDKLKVNENEVDAELKNLIDEQANVIEYKISEIELLFEDQVKAKEKILFIKKKIEEIGFENTAMQFSLSSSASKKGDLGWINEEALSNQFKKVINSMKPGDVSKPIISVESIIILKLDEKKISKINDSDIKRLKSNILNKKTNEIFELYSRSLLSKVKNNSLITSYE